MPREAPRTILSTAVPYQKDVCAQDYEVIVIENGSKRPLSRQTRETIPSGVRIVDVLDAQQTPVFALNWAARELATGDVLLFAIDGARIFTDRLYAETIAAHADAEDAFVYTLAWHLGPKVQMISALEGYDADVEDRLLAASGWPQDPDALYDISVLASSSEPGFFGHIAESNAFSMRRSLFESIGGYDERFVSPGGGLANLEIFHRYVTRPNARNVCLLSEGTFHQIHGGVATSGGASWETLNDEHRAIFGRDYCRPTYEAHHRGTIRAKAQRFLEAAHLG